MHRQTAVIQAALASNQPENPESIQKAQQAAASLEKILGEFSFKQAR